MGSKNIFGKLIFFAVKHTLPPSYQSPATPYWVSLVGILLVLLVLLVIALQSAKLKWEMSGKLIVIWKQNFIISVCFTIIGYANRNRFCSYFWLYMRFRCSTQHSLYAYRVKRPLILLWLHKLHSPLTGFCTLNFITNDLGESLFMVEGRPKEGYTFKLLAGFSNLWLLNFLIER